jgi:DNA primase
MAYDRLGFVEAVESLAESAGLQIPAQSARPNPEPDAQFLNRLFEVQERVARFYHSALKEHPEATRAVQYLKSRGISGELARLYQLGYAPPGWHSLPSDLSREVLEASGLLISKAGKSYDRFRDRIMFPIRDRRGRVVGFGGRVLGDETPKYLNSPETASFKKHKEVYGLYELLKTVPKPQRIVVVEGYMDVIALAQYGIPNVVATLGTVTSSDHISLLFRFTPELVFCFDGDLAGQNAAWKALEASLPTLRAGRTIRFLVLPEKHDPDSLIRSEGTEKFLARIQDSQPFSNYFFEHLKARLGLPALATIEQRTALRNRASPLIEKIPGGTFREMMIRRLDELTGLDPVERLSKSTKLPLEARTAERKQELSLIRTILILLLQNPDLISRLTPEARRCLLNHKKAAPLVTRLLASLEAAPSLTVGGILELFREMPEERWVKKLIAWRTDIAPDRVPIVFADALSRLDKQIKDDRLEELLRKPIAALSAEERKEMRALMSH